MQMGSSARTENREDVGNGHDQRGDQRVPDAEQIEDDEGFAEGDRIDQKIREGEAGGGPRKTADRFSQLLRPPGADPVGGKPRDAGAVPQKQTGRDRDQREHQKQRRNREDQAENAADRRQDGVEAFRERGGKPFSKRGERVECLLQNVPDLGRERIIIEIAAAGQENHKLPAQPVEQQARRGQKNQVSADARDQSGAAAREAQLFLEKAADGHCERAERNAEHEGQGERERMDKQDESGRVGQKEKNVRCVVPPELSDARQSFHPRSGSVCAARRRSCEKISPRASQNGAPACV